MGGKAEIAFDRIPALVIIKILFMVSGLVAVVYMAIDGTIDIWKRRAGRKHLRLA